MKGGLWYISLMSLGKHPNCNAAAAILQAAVLRLEPNRLSILSRLPAHSEYIRPKPRLLELVVALPATAEAAGCSLMFDLHL